MEYKLLVDRETGEDLDESDLNIFNRQNVLVSNAETGEPEIDTSEETHKRRVPFQIPQEVKDKLSSSKDKKKYGKSLEDMIPIAAGTCFAKMNPVFLFLPAIIYFKWFSAILVLFEVIFHHWAHHKNKSLRESDVYYRSPFYGITSEFCALCQDETRMDRVGKMHQIQLHKFLKHCNYIKRAVT